MTGTEIIRECLEDLNVVPVGQTIPSELSAATFRRLCQIIAHWAAQGIEVPHVSIIPAPLVSGQSSYEIGEDGTPDVDTVRPDKIRGGYVRTDAGTDDPLRVLTAEEYMSIGGKAESGQPTCIWYQDTWPNGTLYVWPVPTQSYVMYLFASVPMGEPATAAAEVLIPRSYDLPLIHALSAEVAARYNVPLSPLRMKLAQDSKRAIIGMTADHNLNPPKLYVKAAFAQYTLIEGGVGEGVLLLE